MVWLGGVRGLAGSESLSNPTTPTPSLPRTLPPPPPPSAELLLVLQTASRVSFTSIHWSQELNWSKLGWGGGADGSEALCPPWPGANFSPPSSNSQMNNPTSKPTPPDAACPSPHPDFDQLSAPVNTSKISTRIDLWDMGGLAGSGQGWLLHKRGFVHLVVGERARGLKLAQQQAARKSTVPELGPVAGHSQLWGYAPNIYRSSVKSVYTYPISSLPVPLRCS